MASLAWAEGVRRSGEKNSRRHGGSSRGPDLRPVHPAAAWHTFQVAVDMRGLSAKREKDASEQARKIYEETGTSAPSTLEAVEGARGLAPHPMLGATHERTCGSCRAGLSPPRVHLTVSTANSLEGGSNSFVVGFHGVMTSVQPRQCHSSQLVVWWKVLPRFTSVVENLWPHKGRTTPGTLTPVQHQTVWLSSSFANFRVGSWALSRMVVH